MKRRQFLQLAGAGAGALALSGCSAAGRGAKGGGAPVELTYALWDANQQIGLTKSIGEFMNRNPNIHVTIQQVPYNSYQQKLTEQYISGNAPDVFWVNTPWLADWGRGGVLTDIAPKVKAAGIDMSRYYPALVKLHTDGDHLWGLPKDWDTICFFYNATHLAKCGFTKAPTDLTWNPQDGGSYLHFLKQITLDTKGRNALDPGFDPHNVKIYATAAPNSYQDTFGNYMAQNGGAMLPEPYATKSVLDSPQNLQMFTFITEMLQGAHVAVPGAQTGPNGDDTNTETLFASEQMALWMTGDWNTLTASQLSGFRIGVMPMPAGPKGRASVFNGLIDAVVSNTPHPEEAWQLAQWLGGPESQSIMASGGYVWSAIESLDPKFLSFWKKKGLDMSWFLDAAHGRTVNFPVATGMQEGLTNITTALGPAFLGQESMSTALSQATEIFDYRISYARKK
jgi:multiple sugar transport system substrate-binding protein